MARDTMQGWAAVQKLQAQGLSPHLHQLGSDNLQSIWTLRTFLHKGSCGLDLLVNNAAIAYLTPDSTLIHIQGEVTVEANLLHTQDVCTELLCLIKPQVRGTGVGKLDWDAAPTSRHLPTKTLDSPVRLPYYAQPKTAAEDYKRDHPGGGAGGFMNKFVEDTRNGVHIKEGWPDIKAMAYAASKMLITVLSRIQAWRLSEHRRGDKILLNACHPGWVRTDMGGPKAIKCPEEGVETPVYLALLPLYAQGPQREIVMEKKNE
nr:carbonyl reductase [NADPH] 1-like [Equus caballus]